MSRKYLIDAIKKIDTDNLTDDIDDGVLVDIAEEQKTYFWIRLYLKEDSQGNDIKDEITIKYKKSGETLDTIFISFGKAYTKESDIDTIQEYDSEDNKKVLILMVDEKTINTSTDIPFIRTLFRNGRFYQEQLFKRSDLLFINNRTYETIDYLDCDF